jgi:D-cysteine desulfhydrase
MLELNIAHLPTPLERADRLAAALGMRPGQLWIKRDDCTGLATGGNKARKLQLLVADAIATGCDVLVTGGGSQSNHARLTAAAAARAGMDCVLVFNSDPPLDAEGNQILNVLFGAERRFLGRLPMDDLNHAIARIANDIRADGRTPYVVPVGGSSPLGASAYATAAQEIRDELGDDHVLVVTATASGGTQAGLAAVLGHEQVQGIDAGAFSDPGDIVRRLAIEVAELIGFPGADRCAESRGRPDRRRLWRHHRRVFGSDPPCRTNRGPAARSRLFRQGDGRLGRPGALRPAADGRGVPGNRRHSNAL